MQCLKVLGFCKAQSGDFCHCSPSVSSEDVAIAQEDHLFLRQNQGKIIPQKGQQRKESATPGAQTKCAPPKISNLSEVCLSNI